MNIEMMKAALKDKYPGKTWADRVDKMHYKQVLVVYHSIMNRSGFGDILMLVPRYNGREEALKQIDEWHMSAKPVVLHHYPLGYRDTDGGADIMHGNPYIQERFARDYTDDDLFIAGRSNNALRGSLADFWKPYRTCQHCGANLDPGERCDCSRD